MGYTNKEDAKKYNHEWYLKKRESPEYKQKKKEYDKKYHKTYKNPNLTKEKSALYSKKHRKNNIEKIRQKDREHKKITFQRDRIKHQEYRKKNPEKVRATETKYRNNNRDKIKIINKRSKLKINYGITPEDYQNILIAQNNKCPICGENFEHKKGHLDHDHNTKKVRGVLHMHCNILLGMANEDISILNNAINYLNNNS